MKFIGAQNEITDARFSILSFYYLFNNNYCYYLASDSLPPTKKKRKQEFKVKSSECQFDFDESYEKVDDPDVIGISEGNEDSVTPSCSGNNNNSSSFEQLNPDYFSDSNSVKVDDSENDSDSCEFSTEESEEDDDNFDLSEHEENEVTFVESDEDNNETQKKNKQLMRELTMKLFENDPEYYLGN